MYLPSPKPDEGVVCSRCGRGMCIAGTMQGRWALYYLWRCLWCGHVTTYDVVKEGSIYSLLGEKIWQNFT